MTPVYIGGATTIFFYFLLNLIIKAKALPNNHSSRMKSVNFSAELKVFPSKYSSFSYISSMTFTFSNWKYARLFQTANSPLASDITTSKKLNTATKRSFFVISPHKVRALFLTLLAVVVVSFFIVVLNYNDAIRNFDLRPYFGISTRMRPTTGTSPRYETTPKTRSNPATTLDPTDANINNAKATSTITPTTTELPALSPVNGELFITPDFEDLCPFTIIAGSSTNYYIYLEYQYAPATSSTTRKIKSSATIPFESDVAFYLKGGQQVKINIPVGVYKLYYATGNKFYGTELLFGDNTRFYASDELLSFYTDSQYYNGHTITLKTIANGNFDTDPIPENQFPKR